MAATRKVLDNFELLQSILLHTASSEILVTTSVCTSWRAVVENSKALRTHLMSMPIPKPYWPERQWLFRPYPNVNFSPRSVCRFSVKTANGSCLFVHRDARKDLEIFLLARVGKDNYLKVLDEAYDMFTVTTDFKPDLEFRTKSGEKICRTKCKARSSIDRPHLRAQRNPFT